MTLFFKLAIFVSLLSVISMAKVKSASSSSSTTTTTKTPSKQSSESSESIEAFRPKRVILSSTDQPSLQMPYRTRFGNTTTNVSVDVTQQIPSFLKTASASTKKQYETIMKNKDLSRDERDDAVDALVASQSSSNIKTAYQKFKMEREDVESQNAQKISDIAKTLSSDAEEVFTELTDTLQDKSLTNDEIKTKVESIEHGVSDKSTLKEVMAAVHKVFSSVAVKKTTTENTIFLK